MLEMWPAQTVNRRTEASWSTLCEGLPRATTRASVTTSMLSAGYSKIHCNTKPSEDHELCRFGSETMEAYIVDSRSELINRDEGHASQE